MAFILKNKKKKKKNSQQPTIIFGTTTMAGGCNCNGQRKGANETEPEKNNGVPKRKTITKRKKTGSPVHDALDVFLTDQVIIASLIFALFILWITTMTTSSIKRP